MPHTLPACMATPSRNLGTRSVARSEMRGHKFIAKLPVRLQSSPGAAHGIDLEPSHSLSIRMVAGFAEIDERKDFLVAGARYVPNRQLLNMLFRTELIHCTA